MDALFDKTQLDAAVAVETQFAAVACELVAAGVGVALVDPVTAHFYEDRLEVRPIEPSFAFDFGALTLAGRPQSSVAHRLLDMVAAAIPAASAAARGSRSHRPKRRQCS
jgi:DNA-binding transcriptional LysR family regulator